MTGPSPAKLDEGIVASPADFLAALTELPPVERQAQPSAVFMVMPHGFRVDAQTASDNPYMDLGGAVDPDRALAQAEALAECIEAAGLPVLRFAGDAATPDAVFPNNVFATAPGRFIVGHMAHPARQREAQHAAIRARFADRELLDLSGLDAIAELTGPLVIDRRRGIGFCGMSSRVDAAGLAAMHRAFDLRLSFRFDLAPGEYHTNVVLSVLAGRACVLYPGAFTDPQVPEAIAAAYHGRTLRLDEREKRAFAANCIALSDQDLFMSTTAWRALRPGSKLALEAWGFRVHHCELDEIEKAGGSLRCMVAEVY